MGIAVQKRSIFQDFFTPVLQFFIQQDPLQWYRDKKWKDVSDRFCRSNFTYPSYYRDQPFHGIEGGYLSVMAAVSYDPISRYLLLPHEQSVRKRLIAAIQGQPQRILDLGCGTGSMTLMLKQAFPQAEVIGVDLSPYMLVVADEKSQQAGLDIQFLQRNAEATGFPDRTFDLITAALLFHEIPSMISKAVLRESYRLLKAGGEVIVLDGNQQSLRMGTWVDRIFNEPYIADYAAGSIDAWMGATGFETVQTDGIWWMQQVSRGVKQN